MSSASKSVATGDTDGPLRVQTHEAVAVVSFNRPEKRNAINDALLDDLRSFFSKPPKGVKAVVLQGLGGLDVIVVVEKKGFGSRAPARCTKPESI